MATSLRMGDSCPTSATVCIGAIFFAMSVLNPAESNSSSSSSSSSSNNNNNKHHGADSVH